MQDEQFVIIHPYSRRCERDILYVFRRCLGRLLPTTRCRILGMGIRVRTLGPVGHDHRPPFLFARRGARSRPIYRFGNSACRSRRVERSKARRRGERLDAGCQTVGRSAAERTGAAIGRQRTNSMTTEAPTKRRGGLDARPPEDQPTEASL